MKDLVDRQPPGFLSKLVAPWVKVSKNPPPFLRDAPMDLTSLIQKIRATTQEEWNALAQDWVVNARIWIQEHGERAFIVGAVVGMIVIIFIRLVLGLVIFGGLAAYAVWYSAPKGGQGEGPKV